MPRDAAGAHPERKPFDALFEGDYSAEKSHRTTPREARMPNADLPVHSNRAPQIAASDGLRIREDVLYTDEKGEESERRRKRGRKALGKLKEILPGMLDGNETVLYVVSRCQAPTDTLERLTTNWYTYQATATALVFTNQRILHFGVDAGGRWKRTVKSVRWGGIAEAEVKGWISRQMTLRYASGKKESYWNLGRRDGRKVKAILEAMMPASRGETGAEQEMVSLCPDCREALTPGKYLCGQCGLAFKDEKTLIWRTLLIPGGAYFYTGRWLFGIVAGFTDGILWLVFLYSILAAMNPRILEPPQNGRPATSEGLWPVAVFFLLLVGLHRLIAYRHGRWAVRSHLPLKKAGAA